MRKLLTFAVALSIASSANFVLPSAASAGNGNNLTAADCKTLGPFLGVSEGACIQLVNGNTTANSLCQLWQGPQAALFFPIPYPFNSLGECVSTINGVIRP